MSPLDDASVPIMQQIADSSSMSARPRDPISTRLVIRLDRWIYRFSGRWLFWFNAVSIIVILAAVLAPLLRAAGTSRVADAIYRSFSGVCHQDPERSFHLAGHQMACCERCAAVYASLAMCGVLFGLVRTSVRRPRHPELALLISPLILDGLAVGSGLYDGNMLLRVLTGALFGAGLIWFLYPRFESGFAQMRARLEALFERLVAQGRAAPLSATSD